MSGLTSTGRCQVEVPRAAETQNRTVSDRGSWRREDKGNRGKGENLS